MSLDILRCGVGRWTSAWGDPLITGFVIMALFLFAAGLCSSVAVRCDKREKMFWALAAATALAFAANVHLDLHVLPKSIGHCMAQAQGWYDQKEAARTVFIAGAVIVAGALALMAVRRFRLQMAANIILVLGFALTGGVQASKGFGRKGWDKLYDIPFGPFRLPDLPDVIGAVLMIIGAALALRRLRATAAERHDPGARLP